MAAFKDLSGLKIGKWSILEYAGSKGGAIWLCQCECGTIRNVRANSLLNKLSISCGCYRPKTTKHGHNTKAGQSPTYKTWRAMLARCHDKSRNNYHNYGGRGIKVCQEWLKFENFLHDMGERPSGMTLDRLDVNGNYQKDNCKWSTNFEQGIRMRKNHRITFNGETLTIAQWARKLNIKDGTIRARLSRGWSDEKALSN